MFIFFINMFLTHMVHESLEDDELSLELLYLERELILTHLTHVQVLDICTYAYVSIYCSYERLKDG